VVEVFLQRCQELGLERALGSKE